VSGGEECQLPQVLLGCMCQLTVILRNCAKSPRASPAAFSSAVSMLSALRDMMKSDDREWSAGDDSTRRWMSDSGQLRLLVAGA